MSELRLISTLDEALKTVLDIVNEYDLPDLVRNWEARSYEERSSIIYDGVCFDLALDVIRKHLSPEPAPASAPGDSAEGGTP